MEVLGFLGRSRLEYARQTLPALVEKWHANWCFGSPTDGIPIRCIPASELETGLDAGQGFSTAHAKGTLWMGGDWHALLFAALPREVPADRTASHLIEQARLALANHLLRHLGLREVTRLSNASLSPRGGLDSRLALLFGPAERQGCLLIDAALLGGLTATDKQPEPLVSRATAIGKARLTIKLQLPLASLPIEQVQDLQAGDLLQGTTSLMSPLHVTTAPGQIVAHGYLARQDQHLAIQLFPSAPSLP